MDSTDAPAPSSPVVELLVVPGCPHGEPYLPRLRQLVAAADAEVTVRVIEDEHRARVVGFVGSPTVRIDVDRDAGTTPALTCRLHRAPGGRAGATARPVGARCARPRGLRRGEVTEES